jgi:type IV pilus assembly protein PilY1
MKIRLPLFSLLAVLVLSAGAAQAGLTGISQVPLLNIKGTGAVKPNVMLVYDNSGSMGFDFTPDIISYSPKGTWKNCRAGSDFSTRKVCGLGDPPFSSPDLNKQYYNPGIRYSAPVDAKGVPFVVSTYGNASPWDKVRDDGFDTTSPTVSNIGTGFPDLKWCTTSNGSNCVTNTTGYVFPNATYFVPLATTSNPYYYRINVAEYCKDATLKDCKTVPNVSDPAPAGYPVAARVRWCSDVALSTANCQAKVDDTHVYPRFSSANPGTTASYGTIQISASNGNSSMSISSVTVTDLANQTVTISNSSVNAPNGTLGTTDRATLATNLAASIIAKAGLALQYKACVKTPTGTNKGSVPTCASLGITVNDYIVAVVPLDCDAGATNKNTGCTILADNSQMNWVIGATSTIGTKNDTIPMTIGNMFSGNSIFVRTDIVSGQTYPKDPNRLDCAGTVCTFTEEMSNFANWYAFYRTRNQMMKTAVGQAFAPLSNNYQVGLATLREADATGAIARAPKAFENQDRIDWYAALYATTASLGTPLRSAVNKVAVAFQKNGYVTEPCQPNFMLVTTDGYWNGAPAKQYDSSFNATTTDLPNNDAAEAPNRFCTAATGCTDKRTQGTGETNSLADVALYWYNGGSANSTVSLVPGLEDMSLEGQVSGKDGENKHLHINTYTLGLGVDGIMTYDPNYDKPSNLGGDFSKILAGASGCPWNSNGRYIWPDPVTTDSAADHQSRVDDLWHAAVNGHGKYFNASVPKDVVKGLSSALSSIQGTVGAASAAATSTPNISQADNDIFSDTYTTVKWYGVLADQKINTLDGSVATTPKWITSTTLGKRVSSTADTRLIYMLDTSTGGLKNFEYGTMTAGEKAWFDNRCSVLTQCTTLSDPDKVLANSGDNMVNWLRGRQKFADDNIYRAYSSYQPDATVPAVPLVLGDIASSKPAYLRDPRKAYTLTGYAAYKAKHQPGVTGARKAMVYTAANDGMLHAFDADTGEEQWAYAPRITMSKLAAQASLGYPLAHQFTTDGSPELGDVQIGGVWKSVLVAGLGAGGRGFYAIDVTDPVSPVVLWELCADKTLCSLANGNTAAAVGNIGLTMGNAQFGMWNGKWVVYLTSGYNNVPGVDGVATGDGKGHLFIVDISNGQILKDVSTGSGDATTPSGLARITAITLNPTTDPLTTYIYGGDNQGQMWRFDLTDTVGNTVATVKMGTSGAGQPITTRPDVSTCLVPTTGGATAQRVVVFGTGRLLDVPDTKDATVQSLYLLKDKDGIAGNPIADIRGNTMVQQTLSVQDASHTSNYLVSALAVDLSTKNGWFLDWKINSKERMNLDPRIVNGGVNVVTNVPGESTACSVGGSSNVYQVGLCTGSMPTPDMLAGTTLSSSSAAVGFIIIRLPSGKLKMISTLADGKKLDTEVKTLVSRGARKTGWRRITR